MLAACGAIAALATSAAVPHWDAQGVTSLFRFSEGSNIGLVRGQKLSIYNRERELLGVVPIRDDHYARSTLGPCSVFSQGVSLDFDGLDAGERKRIEALLGKHQLAWGYFDLSYCSVGENEIALFVQPKGLPPKLLATVPRLETTPGYGPSHLVQVLVLVSESGVRVLAAIADLERDLQVDADYCTIGYLPASKEVTVLVGTNLYFIPRNSGKVVARPRGPASGAHTVTTVADDTPLACRHGVTSRRGVKP